MVHNLYCLQYTLFHIIDKGIDHFLQDFLFSDTCRALRAPRVLSEFDLTGNDQDERSERALRGRLLLGPALGPHQRDKQTAAQIADFRLPWRAAYPQKILVLAHTHRHHQDTVPHQL